MNRKKIEEHTYCDITSYCDITFKQMNVKEYHVPNDFDKEHDPEISLGINGCTEEDHLSIYLEPSYDAGDDFYMTITFDVAKQMIRAMQTIINEYDQKGKGNE